MGWIVVKNVVVMRLNAAGAALFDRATALCIDD